MERCREQLKLETTWPENLGATVLSVFRFHQIPPVPYNKTNLSGFLFLTTKREKAERERDGGGKWKGLGGRGESWEDGVGRA